MMLHHLTRLILLLAFSLPLADANAVAEGTELVVDFTFSRADRCSRSSPEIRVSGFPAETARFEIRLKDRNVPSWNHGGGTVANDGSGVIQPGALKSGYNGPCPPSGAHTYEFTVKALDAAGNEIAEGKKKVRFP
jgi:phosphatidylethanolamine-binding protein (PEBP) family uncharacterized protein